MQYLWKGVMPILNNNRTESTVGICHGQKYVLVTPLYNYLYLLTKLKYLSYSFIDIKN